MINRFDSFLVKVAASTEYDQLRREQFEKLRNIHEAVAKTRPKTWKEREIERLAGKQYTPGQLARAGAIGSVFGTGAGLMGAAIEGGRKGLAGAIKQPRRMLSNAARGAVFGAAIPAVKRYSDVRAAESGWY